MATELLHINWIPMSYDAVKMVWTNPAMEQFRSQQKFYLLARGKNMLIFQGVFNENMLNKIDAILNDNSSKSGGIAIFVGQINETKSQLTEIDGNLIENATNILNNHFQPSYYKGEEMKINRNLKIRSEGADFFISKDIVYPA